MQTVIELGRTSRERRTRPLKSPLKSLVVVHSDLDFLADISGELREYVESELNVRELTTCSDPLRYCRCVPSIPGSSELAPVQDRN